MRKPKRPDSAPLDEIIDEFTAEAGTDDERICNFQQAMQTHIWLPCDGSVIGEPVTVIEFLYDGNQRRAVTARCRRSDGREYEVAASDVLIPAAIRGSQYLAAYRQWMGVEPYPPAERRAREKLTHGDAEASIDLSGPVDLIVLSVKQKAARCRLLGSDHTITLRTGRLWDVIPASSASGPPGSRRRPGGLWLTGGAGQPTVDILGCVPKHFGFWDSRVPKGLLFGTA